MPVGMGLIRSEASYMPALAGWNQGTPAGWGRPHYLHPSVAGDQLVPNQVHEQNLLLKDELATLRRRADAANSSDSMVDKLREENLRLLDELASLKQKSQEEEITSLKRQVEAEDLVRAQARLISELEAELAKLKMQWPAAPEVDIELLKRELVEARDSLDKLRAELAQAHIRFERDAAEIARLKARIAELEKQPKAAPSRGRQVYQCIVKPPGVGFRNSPRFDDKNPDGRGPEAPQIVIADGIEQGPSGVFVKCSTGRGWLPLASPDGSVKCFTHLGLTSDVDLSKYQLNDGSDKLDDDAPAQQDNWWSPKKVA